MHINTDTVVLPCPTVDMGAAPQHTPTHPRERVGTPEHRLFNPHLQAATPWCPINAVEGVKTVQVCPGAEGALGNEDGFASLPSCPILELASKEIQRLVRV